MGEPMISFASCSRKGCKGIATHRVTAARYRRLPPIRWVLCSHCLDRLLPILDRYPARTIELLDANGQLRLF